MLELLPAIAAVGAIVFVSSWEPVEAGVLPSASVSWTLLAVVPLFLIAGLGWLSLRAIAVAGLLILIRSIVGLVMIAAVAGAHLYGCDIEPPQVCVSKPSDDEMRVYRASATLNVAIPVVSAVVIALWGVLSLRESSRRDRDTGL